MKYGIALGRCNPAFFVDVTLAAERLGHESPTSRSSRGRPSACGSARTSPTSALRHPFVTARAVQTLDIVSGGRVEFLDEHGREAEGFQLCMGGRVESLDDVARFEEIGVTRLVFAPWERSKEAVEGMRRFADMVGLG